MDPEEPRPVGAPRYEIRQVLSDGSQSAPEFLPLLDPPWDAHTDRRGFLRAGVTATAVLAFLSACRPPGRSQAPTTAPATATPSGAGRSPTPRPTPTPSGGGALGSPTPSPTARKTPKPTPRKTPRKTPRPTPRKTPRPTSHSTCACHSVGGCSCNLICSCNKICTCIPVCQAHRLLDPDPTVRTLAEEIVLVMGATEMEYLNWAAGAAQPALRERIEGMIDGIRAGARPDPARWPSIAACVAHLDAADPVVSLMSAQMLQLQQAWRGADLGVDLAVRVQRRVAEGRAMRWRPQG